MDGQLGQMMEAAELPEARDLQETPPDWALTGAKNRPPNLISSIHLQAEEEEAYNLLIQARLQDIANKEQISCEYRTEDAELLVVAFGTAGRIALSAVDLARESGYKVGLLRPQSLWPFPKARLQEVAEHIQEILVVEMNAGQMIDDVRLAVNGLIPVKFYGRMGGVIPMPDEVFEAIKSSYCAMRVRV
jgi:2-oxoglutarate ferredoxin oxidoreductase subunit alpha